MVESTAVSCIQSSHPDKNNNSVVRIISKEEEREDPRRELQSIFEYSGVSTNNTRTTRFLRIQCILAAPSNSTYRINSSPRNTTTTRLIPVQITTRHLPATAPRASKHSTRQNPVIRLPTALQGHTAQAGFQQFYPIETASKRQAASTHPYSSSQAHSYKNSTRRNRILSKRVKYCISNTILRSVCSNLLILALE